MSIEFAEVNAGDTLLLPEHNLRFSVIRKERTVIEMVHEGGGTAKFYPEEFNAQGFERVKK